jgi:hypothetical protein
MTLGVTSASLSVSPVPLPPALPMFASALLALGIVGFYLNMQSAEATKAA